MGLDIRQMRRQDLELALEWAAKEGWNPGLDDAAAFYSADPTGFLMGWLEDQPVCAISAVRHSDDFGFLGLYICHPEHRGMGYGWQIWQAAMAHFGDRTIGLDGVVEQQANYQKSGFALSHNTHRYAGLIPAGSTAGFRAVSAKTLPAALAFAAQVSGVSREKYMAGWLMDCESRHSLAQTSGDKITALGSIRKCLDGYKIGPLYAPEPDTAKALIGALVATANAQKASVSIDAPSLNPPATALCESLGLEPVFSTARMYKGAETPALSPCEYGLTTMELG